ncbi:hypothetical protein HPB51_010165 [Rhipicephalus microplus]|uniref:Uncharacterized protein n=1 Tax=Rhipicephalus microplus TaxID=6941 RepID=A0A9J6F1H7_RHIMP|nr:hypothetical protein HPB51_010165 [Rhipicephalus microplus]
MDLDPALVKRRREDDAVDTERERRPLYCEWKKATGMKREYVPRTRAASLTRGSCSGEWRILPVGVAGARRRQYQLKRLALDLGLHVLAVQETMVDSDSNTDKMLELFHAYYYVCKTPIRSRLVDPRSATAAGKGLLVLSGRSRVEAVHQRHGRGSPEFLAEVRDGAACLTSSFDGSRSQRGATVSLSAWLRPLVRASEEKTACLRRSCLRHLPASSCLHLSVVLLFAEFLRRRPPRTRTCSP